MRAIAERNVPVLSLSLSLSLSLCVRVLVCKSGVMGISVSKRQNRSKRRMGCRLEYTPNEWGLDAQHKGALYRRT